MPWFVPILAVGGMVGAVGGVIWEKRREAKRLILWRRVAADMGASFHEPGGFWRSKQAAIELEVGVARVRLDTKVVSSGNHTTVYSRGQVCFPLGAAPEFRIFKDGLIASLGNKLGRRDVELGGHEAFDTKFVVRSPASRDQLQSLWTSDAKELVCEHFEKAHFECDGTTLFFKEEGAYGDPEKIRRAIELMCQLGQVDFFGREVLRSVDGAAYHETSGSWDSRSRPFAVLELPSRVVVGPEMIGNRVVTVLRLGDEVRLSDFTLAVTKQGIDGAADALPAHSKSYLTRIGTGHLHVALGKAWFVCDQIADRHNELRQCAEMLASLVPTSTGAYR